MRHTATQPTDPLPCPDYQVVVNGHPVAVHGAKSCQAPFPFKCFKAGTHPGIKLARHGITKHIALFNWTDQPQYTGYTAADLSLSDQGDGVRFLGR